MKKINIYILILSLTFFACTRVETLNLKPHNYGEKGGKIIWIQFPGLEEEQLAMLRFNLATANTLTSLEKSHCIGKMWSFNLFELRPSAFASSLSQILGSKNIKNNCSDIKGHTPIWNFLAPLGYKSVIIEGPSVEMDESLMNLSSCKEDFGHFLGQTSYLRMSELKDKNKDSLFFHYQEKIDIVDGKVSYDKSCQSGKCFSSLASNVKTIWSWLKEQKQNKFLLIRDFSYLHALNRGHFNSAREALTEIENIYQSFINELEKEKDVTLILSSASVRRYEFPEQGLDWAKFQSKGKNILFHRTALTSPVFATGPGAENFCGFYTESELLKRILWRPNRRLGFL